MQYNTRFHTGPQGSCRSLLDLRRFHAYAGCARRRGFVACGTRRGLVILLGAQLEPPLPRVRIRLCIARTVLASFRCRHSAILPSTSLTTQCAWQLLLAHWTSRDSKSGAAAPTLAMKKWEVGSVIRLPF